MPLCLGKPVRKLNFQNSLGLLLRNNGCYTGEQFQRIDTGDGQDGYACADDIVPGISIARMPLTAEAGKGFPSAIQCDGGHQPLTAVISTLVYC